MPRNRFEEILQFLRIANSQRLDPNDQMGQLRPMVDHLQDIFQKAYIPEQHLSFAESLPINGGMGVNNLLEASRSGLVSKCLPLYASRISDCLDRYQQR